MAAPGVIFLKCIFSGDMQKTPNLGHKLNAEGFVNE